MFDGITVGYIPLGDAIYFRGFSGPDILVLHTPPDVDSHRLAATLNGQANLLFEQVKSQSEFKF